MLPGEQVSTPLSHFILVRIRVRRKFMVLGIRPFSKFVNTCVFLQKNNEGHKEAQIRAMDIKVTPVLSRINVSANQ